MSDALNVELDSAPWLPSTGLSAGEVLDFYEVPRAGLLHGIGGTYYFECILGDGRASSVWAYSHIDNAEMARLLGASGPEEMDAAAAPLIAHRWVTVAASRGDRIFDATIFDAGSEGRRGLVSRLLKRWDRLSSSKVSFEELAGSR